MFDYQTLTLRNAGYVPSALQKQIRKTRLLIAGCGVGSTIAEAAVRIGFEEFILADGDVIEAHNLNRQTYTQKDIDSPKVTALCAHLRSINPEIRVHEFNGWINEETSPELVAKSDLIFDTIDFLDMAAIAALHDESRKQSKPLVSISPAGFGAFAMYFPPDGDCTFRQVFGLPTQGPIRNESYVQHFAKFSKRLESVFSATVVNAISKALTEMEDGKPCPAPHLSVGSFAAGSLAVTIATKLLEGRPVTAAPEMIVLDLEAQIEQRGVNLL